VTPRYKLRTLLILLAVLPPLLWIGWTKYEAWRAERGRQAAKVAEERQQVEEMLTAIKASQSNARAAIKAARDATAEAELAVERTGQPPSPK